MKTETIILPTESILTKQIPEKSVIIFESPYQLIRRIAKTKANGEIKNYYSNELFIDLLEQKIIDPLTQMKNNNISFQVLAGYMFESFIMRRINSDNKIKEKTIKWILRESPMEISEIEDFEDISAIVVGSGHTKTEYPDLYSPSHPNIDLLFLYLNKSFYPPLVDIYNRQAGIQIKCIKTNYNNQIIKKIIGKMKLMERNIGNYSRISYPIYNNVLTLLKDEDGKHSYDKCMDLLIDKKLNQREIEIVSQRIIKPEDLGFDQQEIDYYYELIKDWHQNPNAYSFYNLDKNILNSLKILQIREEQIRKESKHRKHLILI